MTSQMTVAVVHQNCRQPPDEHLAHLLAKPGQPLVSRPEIQKQVVMEKPELGSTIAEVLAAFSELVATLVATPEKQLPSKMTKVSVASVVGEPLQAPLSMPSVAKSELS